MLFSIFGINSGGLSIVTNLLVLFLVLVYFALIYWTYLDARRRLEDPVLIACATAASLFPFVGTIVYTILRPPEFLEDVRERELEIRASELRVRELIEQSCPHCEYPIERNFMRCPNCERKLKNPCRSCGKPLDPKWGVCPYCETEVRKQKPREQEQRAPEASGRGERRDRRDQEARAERQRRSQQRAARVAAQQGQRPDSQQRPSRPAPERPDGSSGEGGDSGQPTRTAAERIEDRRQGRTP